MAEAKEEKDKATKAEVIPSHDELLLDNYTEMGLVLVQWIGSKTVSKLAPSPTHISRQLGATDYGLVNPGQFLLVHKNDAKDKRFYKRPTARQKPDKSKIRLAISQTNPLHVRVTWAGMPIDKLDRFNRS